MQPPFFFFWQSMCICITITIQPFLAFNMNHLMNNNKWGHFTAALLISIKMLQKCILIPTCSCSPLVLFAMILDAL